MNRLTLRTAQFGLDYEINNSRGNIPQSEAKAILDKVTVEGIDVLDTASVYGDSERGII